MNFKEYIYQKPKKDFNALREESLKDTTQRKFYIMFTDYYNNDIRYYTTATNMKIALQNVIVNAFEDKKMKGFPSVGSAISSITKNLSRFRVVIKDIKYDVSFKDANLKKAMIF